MARLKTTEQKIWETPNILNDDTVAERRREMQKRTKIKAKWRQETEQKLKERPDQSTKPKNEDPTTKSKHK